MKIPPLTLALLAVLPVAAQPSPAEAQGAGGGWYTPEPGDRLFGEVAGLPVYAPEDDEAGAAPQGPEADLAELGGHALVGHVTDIVFGADGATRGVVLALERHADALPADADAAPDEVVAEVPAEDEAPAVMAFAAETAVAPDRIRFLHDAAAPGLGFAVVSIGAGAVAEAPLVELPREAAAGAAPATDARAEDMPAWQPGRERMTAPQITLDGYAPVPAEQVALSELDGAAVFGEEREHLGNIGRVHLGDGGAISHVTVDVGGFLGIGSREVEIGFDEMTVLRDEGRDALEAHVAATRDTIAAMPEADTDG